MRDEQQKSWCAVSVLSLAIGLLSCSSITPVGSYDPVVPLKGEGKCKGHEHRCRDSCSSAGVEEATCFVGADGKIHFHCVCREGPPVPAEPGAPIGPGIGRWEEESVCEGPRPAG